MAINAQALQQMLLNPVQVPTVPGANFGGAGFFPGQQDLMQQVMQAIAPYLPLISQAAPGVAQPQIGITDPNLGAPTIGAGGQAAAPGAQVPGQQIGAGGGSAGMGGMGQIIQMLSQMLGGGGPGGGPQNAQNQAMGGSQGWGQPLFGPAGTNPSRGNSPMNAQIMQFLERIFPGYSQRAQQAYGAAGFGPGGVQVSPYNPFGQNTALGQGYNQGDPWAAGVADRRAAGYAGDPRFEAIRGQTLQDLSIPGWAGGTDPGALPGGYSGPGGPDPSQAPQSGGFLV